MDDRKRLVLKAIVDHYIKTGRPLSSQTLLKEYGLDVSSATIRNDMKALEQEGLIAKEYSSAGRVPTEKGFRFFVDWLLELSELTRPEEHALMESYRLQRQPLEELLKQTALLLAGLSGYAGFVLSPRLEETRLESITFVKLDEESALVVILSELGIVEHRILPTALPAEELEEIGRWLSERLRGRTLSEVREEAQRYVAEAGEGWHDPRTQSAFQLLQSALERRLERRLYTEGLFNLLQKLLEEEVGLAEVRDIVRLLSESARFGEYLESQIDNSKLQVRIGSENALRELRPCSLVLMGYGFSGVLGVLGPVRMNYSKACSITQYIGNRLEGILTLSRRAPAATEAPEVKPS